VGGREHQNKNQIDQISSMKNKISNLEKRLEEQEQYSRRPSLRFSNVRVPTLHDLLVLSFY
jgi:hypothetical protein